MMLSSMISDFDDALSLLLALMDLLRTVFLSLFTGILYHDIDNMYAVQIDTVNYKPTLTSHPVGTLHVCQCI